MEDLNTIKTTIEVSSLYTTVVGGIIVIVAVTIGASLSKAFRVLIHKGYYNFISIFKKDPYEVSNLRKHTTICHNGHIIVLHDFTLKINKKTSDKFSRMFDVSDASDKCKLPNLKKMIETKKDRRFLDYGFWYHSNPENIFEEVKETDPSSNNYKHRKFYFKFNKKNLKTLSTNKIKLMYGYSVKYGQPLTNGYFDKTLINEEKEPVIISGFRVLYKMDSLEYIFSFEDVVKIKKEEISVFYYPDGIDNEYSKKELRFDQKDDLYYNKFVVNVSKPKINSLILIRVPVEPKSSN